MPLKTNFLSHYFKLQKRFEVIWKELPFIARWPLAMLRQLPVTVAVAKLPIPYNFAVPAAFALAKTIKCSRSKENSLSLGKYYFKTISRTLFGFSMRRFIEQTAKYTLNSQLDISDDALQAIGWCMILICVLMDALE